MCFFKAEDGIRVLVRFRGLGDVYKRQVQVDVLPQLSITVRVTEFAPIFKQLKADGETLIVLIPQLSELPLSIIEAFIETLSLIHI